MPIDVQTKLLESIVYTVLLYVSEVWGFQKINMLEIFQKTICNIQTTEKGIHYQSSDIQIVSYQSINISIFIILIFVPYNYNHNACGAEYHYVLIFFYFILVEQYI